MAYKKIEQNFSFADIAVQNNADKNRSLQFLNKLDNTIDWEPIQELLLKFYETGKAKKGERAYPPLFGMFNRNPTSLSPTLRDQDFD